MWSCDDGDIIDVTLDFEDDLDYCGSLVFYKTKDNPAETLSIQLSGVSLDDLKEVGDDNRLEKSYRIDGTNNRFNYRTYGSLPATPFCSEIPPTGLDILNDDESTTGEVNIVTVL